MELIGSTNQNISLSHSGNHSVNAVFSSSTSAIPVEIPRSTSPKPKSEVSNNFAVINNNVNAVASEKKENIGFSNLAKNVMKVWNPGLFCRFIVNHIM